MAAVVPAVFQARLEEIVNSQKEAMKLLQAETEIHIAKRQELHQQQSRERHFRQLSFKTYVEAEDIAWKLKALEDQRAAANLKSIDLESQLKCSHAELVELEIETDRKRKFYARERAELRDFTLHLRNRTSNVHTETKETVTNADEPSDSQRVRQLTAASQEDDQATDVNEIEISRLMSAKQEISCDIRANLHAISILEKKLQEALRDPDTKKRELEAAVETLKAEIEILHATERKLEDAVLQSITRRDQRTRELSDLKCTLASKKRSLFNGNESREDV